MLTQNRIYRHVVLAAIGFTRGDDSRLQLVLNPSSLNIRKPSRPESMIKAAVEEYLQTPGNVRNIQLRSLFACLNKNDQNALCDSP